MRTPFTATLHPSRSLLPGLVVALGASTFAPLASADDAPAGGRLGAQTNGQVAGPAGAASPSEATAAKPKSAEDEARERTRREIDEMKLQLERLSTEYQLMQQRQRNDLARAELEKQELTATSGLEQAKLEQELASLRAEVARIRASAELDKARRDQQDSTVEVALSRQALEAKQRTAELERALEETKLQSQKMASENALRQEELKRAQMETQLAQQQVRVGMEAELTALKGAIDLRAARDGALAKVVDPVGRRANPLDGDVLFVSDRRISLNGPIGPGTADFVCDRIDYFNNHSKTDPIFIVIDSSPGGSVMEGYRIVNAIEQSPAPVHVVVKSFAASMAAIITTLAPHSYALPNALILHHQMSSGMSGNLTQQKERLEHSMEWARRLAEPLAAKMGVSYDDLVKQMYANNSDGDWREFAQRAKELKWVDHVVTLVREEGLRDQPAGERASLPFWMEAMQRDEKGRPFVQLPPLMPLDFWAMYNPDDFWR
jgi:ATP-dependent Clp protease protease subunit